MGKQLNGPVLKSLKPKRSGPILQPCGSNRAVPEKFCPRGPLFCLNLITKKTLIFRNTYM